MRKTLLLLVLVSMSLGACSDKIEAQKSETVLTEAAPQRGEKDKPVEEPADEEEQVKFQSPVRID